MNREGILKTKLDIFAAPATNDASTSESAMYMTNTNCLQTPIVCTCQIAAKRLKNNFFSIVLLEALLPTESKTNHLRRLCVTKSGFPFFIIATNSS